MVEVEKSSEQTSGSKKERSPSFPYIGLTKALERARQVYQHARRHEVRLSDAATAWGLGAKSSATLQTAAALLAFGLLEDQGSGDNRKLKITDLAFRALEDLRPGAREAALAEAAIKPKLIAEYLERWSDGRPADSVCESELRIDRGFTDDGAKAFLRVFDDTTQYTKSQVDDKKDDKMLDPPKARVEVGNYVQWTSSGSDQFPKPLKVISISDDGNWLWVDDPTTKAAIPMEQVEVRPAPPPATIQYIEASEGGGSKLSSDQREEKFALTEGDVVIRFPEGLSADSVDDLEAYLKVFLRKAQREAGIKKSD